jgi:cellulose synthase/poly-beta-1,6-N-acetylglucosamine synthase-like glycosyltransferase
VPTVVIVLATSSLLIWLYLALARGIFWRLRPFDDDQAKHLSAAVGPPIVAIVPARNEAQTIGQTIAALLQQDYQGQLSVIVVDDHSEDATTQIAQQTAKENAADPRVQILRSSPLPPGWTGKLWALNEGISLACASTSSYPDLVHSNMSSRAERGTCVSPIDDAQTTDANDTNPSYFWFTDADVVHAPDTLRRLVARAEQDKLDLTSLMVLLRAKTLPERMLIPAFLFFFLKLYPPRWTPDPRARNAGAAGGCILLRRQALERIGGLSAIRGEIIDDCALARVVKRTGGRVWMSVTRRSVSLREYRTFSEIRDMIARTAFTQLGYSTLLLLGTLFGMLLTYIAPVALLFAPGLPPRILGACAWTLLSLLYLPTLRFYRLSPLWAPLLPVTAAFYSYATLLSAVRYLLGRGAQWKGRTQVA